MFLVFPPSPTLNSMCSLLLQIIILYSLSIPSFMRIPYTSNLSLSPLLSFRRRRSVLAFIVFLWDIRPICWKNRPTACLETFHHGFSFLLIGILEDFLEEQHARINWVLFWMFNDVFFNLILYLIPVFLCFGTWRITDLLCFLGLSQTSRVFSQRKPWDILLFLLHHDFYAFKSMYFFSSCSYNVSIEIEF